jgi:selenide, water dikinase
MKNVVLIGGGHSHAIALRLLGLHPIPNVQLTLITNTVHAPYSGMLPGHLSGIYSFQDCHIDLRALANFAGAKLIVDEAIGLDLEKNHVFCRQHPPIPFDELAIDIGSTPSIATVPGAQELAIAVKPVPQFLAAWQEFLGKIPQWGYRDLRIAIVGGGAGGVELALNLQHSTKIPMTIDLFHRQDVLMNRYPASIGHKFEKLLLQRGIRLHLNANITAIKSLGIPGANKVVHYPRPGNEDYSMDYHQVLWVTEATAPRWLGAAGLATDRQGFILINDALASISHPHIFATGDIATNPHHPRPKAGVFAVRQGQPLAENLRRSVNGQPLQPYIPQSRYLSLIGLGDRRAIATWGNFSLGPSKQMWTWKDRIDRQFMAQFANLL